MGPRSPGWSRVPGDNKVPDIRPAVCIENECAVTVTMSPSSLDWTVTHEAGDVIERTTLSHADLKSGAVHPIHDVQAWAEGLHA